MAAITADHPFLVKHADHVHGVLSCFDRVIFRGYLPLSYPQGMQNFLLGQKVLLKHFKDYAPNIAERIKDHVKAVVAAAGAPYRHLPTKIAMEAEARALVQAKNLREGIVCGFSQNETCRSFRFDCSGQWPALRADYRRSLVLYVFVLHAVLGLIHVKIHTWFPLTMQVYVNGHDFLARQLDTKGIAYTLADNAFLRLGDVPAAQACADRFATQNWPKLLRDLAAQFNPLVGHELRAQDYYWVTDQAEYATDVLFQSPAALTGLYPRLVEHARTCLSAADVLKFLGRKLHPTFQGEVQTHTDRRVEGVRVVHRMKANKLKMYDKAGQVLRIETTINDPTEFKVRRRQAGRRTLTWQPLRKGVAWLWRYADVCRGANGRYLGALAVVDDDRAARRLLDRATRPAQWHGRRKRALQPLSPADQALFRAVLAGEHRLRGFRNRDLAARLYARATPDAAEHRRRCGRVTRLIQLMRAHGLVAKIPRTRRYRMMAAGELLMSAAVRIREVDLPQQMHVAA